MFRKPNNSLLLLRCDQQFQNQLHSLVMDFRNELKTMIFNFSNVISRATSEGNENDGLSVSPLKANQSVSWPFSSYICESHNQCVSQPVYLLIGWSVSQSPVWLSVYQSAKFSVSQSYNGTKEKVFDENHLETNLSEKQFPLEQIFIHRLYLLIIYYG